MAQVIIKAEKSKDANQKHKLLEILHKHDTYATRIIPINVGFIVLTQNDSEMDKLLNGKTNKKLKDSECTPITPPQLKGNRSVLLLRVNKYIYNKRGENKK